MCLILFAYRVVDDYPLVLAANRDEFHQRPTAPMDWWEDRTGILAGRDLEAGGTWFGVRADNSSGSLSGVRFAGLTNYRNPAAEKKNARSRGEIIPDYLHSCSSAETYFKYSKIRPELYNGFNLLFGDPGGLFWFSGQTGKTTRVQPGIHGLSNRDLNTPWPKVETGRKRLEQALNNPVSHEDLFRVLTHTAQPEDSQLPDTGVGMEWERILAPLFIQNPVYGTRSSTLFLLKKDGSARIIERTWTDPTGKNSYSDRKFLITAGS